MTAFAGRRVVLGICGGIAAYKAIEVCRRLVDGGAHVVPIMTDGATRFIGEVTVSALASEPVRRSLWDAGDPIPHTQLGQQADVIVVAPATARLLSAYAAGYSHDLLTNTLIATRAPVVVCPAMHTEMWEHPAVQENLATLRARGVFVVEPEAGRLAGGDVGTGRLAAPEAILAGIEHALVASATSVRDLEGLRVLVSAGGTREPIDPVRFLGNRSSGKQGHALAEEAAARGALVTLVTTTELPVSDGIERVAVQTADELHRAVTGRAAEQDVIVMAAAVADFTPVHVADTKLKKHDGVPSIELRPTVDVLAELGASRRDGQTIVGFAAETTDVERHARAKLEAKQVDLLVVNDVSAAGVGFEHDTNEVLLLDRSGSGRHVALTDKRRVAAAVVDAVVKLRASGT
ncbi:MAG: bifunctional phosphopantothenoylcysteine decarboxylase/phosphopantothenate--cysteine ligase CoaBC [Microthrixaceae bacterium]